MMPRVPSPTLVLDEHGYTLIELLIGMVLTLIVTLGAFSLLEFTSSDVSRITGRVHVQQAGRVALENIMLKLHSACVAPQVNPIQENSNATSIAFISEHGSQSAFNTVTLHELVYTPKSGKVESTLVEKTWVSEARKGSEEYQFKTSTTPSTTTLLLTGIKGPLIGGKETIFQYYRYWEAGETGAVLGEINPNELGVPLTKAHAEEVTKVNVKFILGPESGEASEGTAFNHDQAVAFEDSAVLRLSPASSTAGIPNEPCATTV